MKLVWIRLSQNDKQVQSTLYGQLMQKALVAPIGGEHKTHCTLAGPGKTCSVTEIKKDWLLLFVSVLAEGDKLVFWEHLNTKPYYVDVKFSCGPGNLHRKLYLSVQHLKKSTNQTRPSSFILLQHLLWIAQLRRYCLTTEVTETFQPTTLLCELHQTSSLLWVWGGTGGILFFLQLWLWSDVWRSKTQTSKLRRVNIKSYG